MRTRFNERTEELKYNVPGLKTGGSAQFQCGSTTTPEEWYNSVWQGDFPTVASTDVTYRKTTVDELTPDFHKRMKAGEILPTNHFSSVEQLITPIEAESVLAYTAFTNPDPNCRPGDWTKVRWRGTAGISRLTLPEVTSAPDLFSQSEIDALSREALSRLRSQGMDALTSVVEFNQTLAMLAGARRKLIKLFMDGLRFIRKKGYKDLSVLGTFDAISNLWLEGRFGWRILYYDLLAILEFVDGFLDEKRLIVGRSLAEKTRTSGSDGLTDTTTHVIRFGYPGILDPKVIGNSGIVNTIWEVIPFSLVVDMFFDVQNWILSLSGQAINVDELPASAFVSSSKRRVVTAQAQPRDPFGANVVLHNVAQPLWATYQVRTRGPTGMPELGLPSFYLNIGGYKALDLAFLLRIIAGKV